MRIICQPSEAEMQTLTLIVDIMLLLKRLSLLILNNFNQIQVKVIFYLFMYLLTYFHVCFWLKDDK